VLSGTYTEAILSMLLVKHQYSSALFLPKHEDGIPQTLQPPKEVDSAATLGKYRRKGFIKHK
jgi:hypothetical protein